MHKSLLRQQGDNLSGSFIWTVCIFQHIFDTYVIVPALLIYTKSSLLQITIDQHKVYLFQHKVKIQFNF